jgi:hypothetical protein
MSTSFTAIYFEQTSLIKDQYTRQKHHAAQSAHTL